MPENEKPEPEQPERPEPTTPVPPPAPVGPPPKMCPILTLACVQRNENRNVVCQERHCGVFNPISGVCGLSRLK